MTQAPFNNPKPNHDIFHQIIQDLSARTESNANISPADYTKDGILYCHVCNEPKQCLVPWPDGARFQWCMCKCDKDKWAAEKIQKIQQEKFDRIRRLRVTGFPDAEMASWTFDKDDSPKSKLSRAARRYVENFGDWKKKGKGLLLFGPVGTGKSFIGACIANALIEHEVPCMMTNFARLVNNLQSSFEGRQEYLDSLNLYDLLVIDDLAAERDTEYMQETIMSIIDARYRSKLPLIVTTNLTAEELKSTNDTRKARIYSRLLEMCVPVEVNGSDRRKSKLRNDYKEDAHSLGLDEPEDDDDGLVGMPVRK